MFSTEDSLSAVYSDKAMNTVVYHLHAVLVHQGQASGGHYWSYVRKPPSLRMETLPVPRHPGSVAAEPLKASLLVTDSEVAMTGSPAMSTESGGGGGGEGEGEGAGGAGAEEKRDGGKRQEGERDPKRGGGGGGWLKFNDVSVHEVVWEEVVKESYGGRHNTSAYCLIYLSPLLHQTWSTSGEAPTLPYSSSIDVSMNPQVRRVSWQLI